LNPRSSPRSPPRSPPHPPFQHRLPLPTRARRARRGQRSWRGPATPCRPPTRHLSRPREAERIHPTPRPLIRGAAAYRCQHGPRPTPCSQRQPSSPRSEIFVSICGYCFTKLPNKIVRGPLGGKIMGGGLGLEVAKANRRRVEHKYLIIPHGLGGHLLSSQRLCVLMSSQRLCVLSSPRLRAKREQLERYQGLSPESQGQTLALTVLDAPYSIDSGR